MDDKADLTVAPNDPTQPATQVIAPTNAGSAPAPATDANAENTQNNSALSAPVWFFYPQKGAINLKRHFYEGTLSVNVGQLSVYSVGSGQVAGYPLNSIKQVKRAAPVMTFYFDDDTKFQVDFRNIRQNIFTMIPLIGALISLSSKSYKQGLINMKQFEEYFQQVGL